MSKKKSNIEKQVMKRYSEMEYDTDRLGPGGLMTQQSHINSSRMIMTSHQLSDLVNIKDPEAPLVPTGFENVLGSFSTMLDQADGDYEVVAKFEKNRYNYILIGYDKKAKRYHAWRRKEMEEHSEGFATRYNNSFMDSLEIGDKIDKGEYVQKSESFDKYMNYRYGKNLNVVYLVGAQVLEDGIMVMNGAENKMNAYRTTTEVINLADNEILLNWYGDDSTYQPLPMIGERTKNDILAVIRRVDNAKAPYSLKKKYLRTIERGDQRKIGAGRVIDIDILYNKDRDKLPDVGANKMIRELYDQQQDYYKKLYKYMIGIVDRSGDEGYTYSDEFSMICREAEDYINSSVYFSDGHDNIFGNMQIRITLMNEERLIVGSKLVGRTGNKGVISRIVSPEESWHMEDGTPIELIVATLGIVGRLNQAQMNEHSINELSATAVEMMKKTDNLDTKGNIIYKLMKYLNSDEADDFKKFYKKLNEEEKRKFCKRTERDGIIIVQDPIDNANMFDIGEAFKDFPPKWQHIVFPDGRKSMRRVLCAKMFYIRLKQDPLEKYSARSRGPVNPLTTLPAKSNDKKRGITPFSDVAVRIGEYEIEVLLAMVNHPAAIADFMTENSTSWPAKMLMAEHNYLDDPDSEMDMSEAEFTGRKNLEAIGAYNNILDAHIRMEVETSDEAEFTD